MKTFEILYDFYDQTTLEFRLGRAVVITETENDAEEMFKFECENYSDIIRIEELSIPQIVWVH